MKGIGDTRYAALEVDEDAVLTFPEGLIGLPGTTYTLVAHEDGSPFHWLHSLEDPGVAVPVTSARRAGERICLGEEVVVTVLEITGSTVRLGIEAPAEVPVYRYEIRVAIEEENRAAAATGLDELPIATTAEQG